MKNAQDFIFSLKVNNKNQKQNIIQLYMYVCSTIN